MKKQRAFSMKLSRGVIVAKEDTTALELACLMEDNNIGAVVILDGENLTGIVSERDVVRRVVSKGLRPDKVQAKDFMTKDVKAAEFKDGIDKIYETLCVTHFRHLPIMDNGKLVGIASQRDVLYSLAPRGLDDGDDKKE